MAYSILPTFLLYLLEWQELGTYRANIQYMSQVRLPRCWGVQVKIHGEPATRGYALEFFNRQAVLNQGVVIQQGE